jgi:1-phosphofructokinase family hexose kinase
LILTLTANPAVDRTVTTDRLVFDDRAYILSTGLSAGGRGINASHVIHSFGGQTEAIVASGGKTGASFEGFLRGAGFPIHVVRIRHNLRTNLTVTDKTGLSVKLNELGPPMSKAEVERLEKTVREHLGRAKWLMLCGSLPPGVPWSFYSKLIKTARDSGVKTLLDTDGPSLLEGTEAGPTVVTPNQQEAERLLNKALITRNHFLEAAERIHRMGAESVILSLGSRGGVGAWQERLVEAIPPAVDALCPIGSGDAMAAAFVWAMTQKDDFTDALRWAVAAGTASARLPGMTFASIEETKAMYSQVELRFV